MEMSRLSSSYSPVVSSSTESMRGFAPPVMFSGVTPESADLNGSSSKALRRMKFLPLTHGPMSLANEPLTTCRTDATPSMTVMLPLSAWARRTFARALFVARICVTV